MTHFFYGLPDDMYDKIKHFELREREEIIEEIEADIIRQLEAQGFDELPQSLDADADIKGACEHRDSCPKYIKGSIIPFARCIIPYAYLGLTADGIRGECFEEAMTEDAFDHAMEKDD